MGDYQPFFPNGWQPAPNDADCCQPVAAIAATDDGLSDWGAGADFRRFQRQRATIGVGVAAVATVAAPSLPWGAGLAKLERLPCPDWLAPDRWERLVYEAVALSRDWGEQAHAFGWDALELFGCHPEPWKYRVDRDGLALTLADWRGPIRVRAITTDAITMEVDHGHIVRRTRFDRSGAVPLWIGYAPKGGP